MEKLIIMDVNTGIIDVYNIPENSKIDNNLFESLSLNYNYIDKYCNYIISKELNIKVH